MIKVEIVRGNFIESRHHVYAVVVDENGKLVKEFGDSKLIASPRSAIKMLQALPLVETGAFDHYRLVPQQLSLACASHNGEDLQIKFIEEWMARTGLEEKWLHCGAHDPIHEPTKREWIKAGKIPTQKVNNCSGKHLGIMTTALYLQEDPKTYWEYDHPRQKRLRSLLTEICEYDHDKASWGVDGCGIPTYGVPIFNMAVGMSYLIRPNKVSADLQVAATKILNAVKEYPYFISGSNDFTTDTIKLSGGRCLIKVGAEGVFCGVIPDKGYAFALKTLDGSFRGAEPACAWILQQFGGLSSYNYPVIKNWAGETVGQIQITVD